jgi:hypothetical protein
VKVVPCPGVLFTVISPPISSVSMRAMVRPRPVLPADMPLAAEPRSKGSNTAASSASAHARAGVLDLEARHLALVVHTQRDLAAAR